MLGGFFALVLAFGLALPAWANEGTASEFDCNQDPVYARDMDASVKISSRLRNMPCMDESEVIKILAQGQGVKIIAETDGWYKVKTTDGTTGWVGATLLTPGGEVTTTETKTTSTDSSSLISRLKGYILLQVEKKGEAWYVSPENGFRYFLKDGDTAFNIMREMGLGISNANLEKLKAKQSNLLDKLKGKIVLQVEKNGEAYYINPKTGTLHYLKNGWEAFKLMRDLSLGIKNTDLAKIKDQTLEQYLLKKQELNQENESSDNNGLGKIVLSGSVADNKVSLKWALNGLTSQNGFKVVIANHENPVYPGDEYHYLSDANVRADSWSGLSAGTYYFRVCEYLGGKCGVYSNNVKLTITAAAEEEESDGSITLSGSVNSEGIAALNWTLADMTSSMGFKVVVADHQSPVYPGDEYHYLSDANTRTDSWSGLSGTKYFRVCEYLGGKCGVYSNNLSLQF